MLIVWLIIWVFSDTPSVTWNPMNGWALALIICAFCSINIGGSGERG